MRRLLFVLCLLTPMAQASDKAHDLAYSLGVRLGERLRDEVPALELQALLQGLAQAYRNEPLELDSVRIDSLLAEHEALLEGAHWRLVIPSAEAYGAEGAGDLIAPYSPLIFELELLDIRD